MRNAQANLINLAAQIPWSEVTSDNQFGDQFREGNMNQGDFESVYKARRNLMEWLTLLMVGEKKMS